MHPAAFCTLHSRPTAAHHYSNSRNYTALDWRYLSRFRTRQKFFNRCQEHVITICTGDNLQLTSHSFCTNFLLVYIYLDVLDSTKIINESMTIPSATMTETSPGVEFLHCFGLAHDLTRLRIVFSGTQTHI